MCLPSLSFCVCLFSLSFCCSPSDWFAEGSSTTPHWSMQLFLEFCIWRPMSCGYGYPFVCRVESLLGLSVSVFFCLAVYWSLGLLVFILFSLSLVRLYCLARSPSPTPKKKTERKKERRLISSISVLRLTRAVPASSFLLPKNVGHACSVLYIHRTLHVSVHALSLSVCRPLHSSLHAEREGIGVLMHIHRSIAPEVSVRMSLFVYLCTSTEREREEVSDQRKRHGERQREREGERYVSLSVRVSLWAGLFIWSAEVVEIEINKPTTTAGGGGG